MSSFKMVVIFVVLLLLLAGILWIFLPSTSGISRAQQLAEMKRLLGRNVHLSGSNQSNTWFMHTSRAVSFLYPSWAKVYTADNIKAIQGNVLDSFSLGLLDEHMYILVQAVQFSGQLAEFPGVAARLSQPDIYTPDSSTSAGAISFSKNADNVEQTGFFAKNGKIVSVAVTGFSQEKVASVYAGIVQSLVIK